MTTKTLSASALARVLGKTERTVRRWPAMGCPVAQEKPLRFNEAEVRAWCAGRGLKVAPPRNEPAPTAPSPGAPRLDAKAADLVRKVTAAKKDQREYDAERRLKDLGLDEKIRGVKTHEDLLTYTLEVMALIGSGDMIPERGRVLRSLVAEATRALRVIRESDGDVEPERIHLASPQGVALLEAFEWIVSDERRAEILAHVQRERELDEEEFDTFDLAANMAPDAEGEDPMPEEEAA